MAKVDRTSPASSESSGGSEKVVAEVAAGGGEGPSIAGPSAAGGSALATPKPDGVIYFIEGFAINPTSVINDLYEALRYSFPVPNPEGPTVLLLELNGISRRRLVERAPLNPRIIHAMDDDSLNSAEEIVCKIIPNLFAITHIEVGQIKTFILVIGINLKNYAWDILDKAVRDEIINDLEEWKTKVISLPYSRALLKDSMRKLFKHSIDMFNIFCKQVQVKRISYVLPQYYDRNLLQCQSLIDEELAAYEPAFFTAKISDDTILATRNLIEYLFVICKVRNLLFVMDEVYPRYASMVDVRVMPKPVIFYGLVSILSGTMITNIQAFIAKAGIKKLTGLYSLTNDFLGVQLKEEERKGCRKKLYDILHDNLKIGAEMRDLSIEMTLMKSRYLWFGNRAVFEEVCKLMLLLVDKKKKPNFTLCNTEEFWSKFSTNDEQKVSLEELLHPYEIHIAERETSREQNLGVLFVDAELVAKKEAMKKYNAKLIDAENDKRMEEQIAALVALGISQENATLQAVANRQAKEEANKGGSKKVVKGKGKKRTRKNLRQRHP